MQQVFENFNNLNVVIIGDVMIDSYIWGKVERISPEAPVPVVTVKKREDRLGGAANVALNVQALGANPILVSCIGDDLKGGEFIKLLDLNKLSTEGIVASKNRITTTKFRVIGNSAQLLRVDEEIDSPVSDSETLMLFEKLTKLIAISKIDVIVFEDYDKGVITPNLIKQVVDLANKNNIPLITDPKKRNFIDYKNVTIFKPNLKELREGLKMEIENRTIEEIDLAVTILNKEINAKIVMVTLSELGVYIYEDGKSQIIPAHKRDVADVAGAGDTMVSVAALCLALGLDIKTIAEIANLAGGLVCEKVGVVPVSKALLLAETLKIVQA